MEQIKQMLALMDRPAFCAEGDSIRALNTAARSLALCEGTPLSELLPPTGVPMTNSRRAA